MKPTTLLLTAAAAAGLSFASTANAQLVVGTTTPTTTNAAAFYINMDTLVATPLWNSAAQKKVNGLAADPATGRLYCNDAARLNYWNYGSIGTAPTLIAGMYRTNDNVAFTATGVDGLAWANGNLYGVTTFGSTTYKRGIYRIATESDGAATPHCIMTPLWLDPTGIGTSSGTISLGGLEFNPANNKFYITNSASTADYQPGIYTIDAFGTGELTRIAEFPNGLTRIDGLALGGGKLWLTLQNPGTSQILIYPLDLATLQYGTPLALPLTDGTNRASGACWAPGALSVFVPPPTRCSVADVVADGTIDGNDFIAFINSFGIGDATVDPAADVAGAGTDGLLPDGTIDGNDFIAFINAFAIGC